MRPPAPTLFLLLLASTFGCGAAPPRPSPPPGRVSVVRMAPLRITAHAEQSGRIRLEAYDAETLFRDGTEALDAGRCEEAAATYRRLADEFPESRALSAALYNAGWCLLKQRRHEEAAVFFERLLRERPDSPDVRDARFLLAAAYFETKRWEPLRHVSEAILEERNLDPDERIEASSYRAQALLGLARETCEADGPPRPATHDESEPTSPPEATSSSSENDASTKEEGCERLLRETIRQARVALSLGRWETQRGNPPSATNALAAAQFAIGEVHRLRAEAISIPPGDAETQHEALERRARHTLQAQRAYTDTVRWGEPRWSAPAGYRIGALYDGLWEAIDRAPPPPPRQPLRPALLPHYREEYRRELHRRIRPLLRHAIRYWELTRLVIERSGVEGPWAEQVRAGLRRVRARLKAIGTDEEGAAARPEGGAGGTDAPRTTSAR